jgi:ferric-dicitrate binding protein FerR (iron transport regulator)
MDAAPSKELLARFYRGQCTEAEHRRVVTWLQSAAGQEGVHAAMEDQWEGLKKEQVKGPPDDRQLFDRIQASIRPAAARTYLGISRRALRLAASVAGILLVAGLTYWLLGVPREVEYASGYGQTRTVTLPDQSTVVLNGNSSIHLVNNWGTDRPRTVRLEGEAFFSVVHTRSHQPFVVRTSDQFAVQVLGTQFNVSSRQSGTRVILKEGRIELDLLDARVPSARARKVVMQPGELVEFKDNPTAYTRRMVNAELFSAWTDNKLILQNTSLGEIITVLEESYGFRVRVTDPQLLLQQGSGSIPTDDPEVLLATIAEVFNLRMNRNGVQVTFSPSP